MAARRVAARVVPASVMLEGVSARHPVRGTETVVGALVLAAVTSLPNAVAAVWPAARGRAPEHPP
jgi:hypothetical protein